MEIFAGQIIRQARKRVGISQAQLALRAGTTQAAISRLENDQHSPSLETLRKLLLVMGEDIELKTSPLERDYDPIHMVAEIRSTPSERLERAFAWNKFSSELVGAANR